MKYAEEERVVRMLIIEKHPFKGVENYFTGSLLYQDPLEATDDPSSEESDSAMKLTLNQSMKKDASGS